MYPQCVLAKESSAPSPVPAADKNNRQVLKEDQEKGEDKEREKKNMLGVLKYVSRTR